MHATTKPTKYPATDYQEGRDFRCRTIIPTRPEGWPEIALFEWELTAESWSDRHPHSEYNFVIEGELFVECDGITLRATRGDVVHVPPHQAGRYFAPVYARLLAIYGPSTGGTTERLGHRKL